MTGPPAVARRQVPGVGSLRHLSARSCARYTNSELPLADVREGDIRALDRIYVSPLVGVLHPLSVGIPPTCARRLRTPPRGWGYGADEPSGVGYLPSRILQVVCRPTRKERGMNFSWNEWFCRNCGQSEHRIDRPDKCWRCGGTKFKKAYAWSIGLEKREDKLCQSTEVQT